MMKGKIIINYERDEETESCNYDILQEGNINLEREDLISLFTHVVSELMDEAR